MPARSSPMSAARRSISAYPVSPTRVSSKPRTAPRFKSAGSIPLSAGEPILIRPSPTMTRLRPLWPMPARRSICMAASTTMPAPSPGTRAARSISVMRIRLTPGPIPERSRPTRPPSIWPATRRSPTLARSSTRAARSTMSPARSTTLAGRSTARRPTRASRDSCWTAARSRAVRSIRRTRPCVRG